MIKKKIKTSEPMLGHKPIQNDLPQMVLTNKKLGMNFCSVFKNDLKSTNCNNYIKKITIIPILFSDHHCT